MSQRQCQMCGQDPAEGHASITSSGIERFYCHEGVSPTCYELGQRDVPCFVPEQHRRHMWRPAVADPYAPGVLHLFEPATVSCPGVPSRLT